MPEESGQERDRSGERRRARREPEPIVRRAAGDPGPARLYALLAGAGLTLLGIVGFFYDGGFGTGSELGGDDVVGLLIVNGWRNVVYLATGLMALALATSRPRLAALGLGVVYLAVGIAGALATDNDMGSLLDALPLTDEDNLFHIAIGALGLLAFAADGGLPRPTERRRPRPGPKRSSRRADASSSPRKAAESKG